MVAVIQWKQTTPIIGIDVSWLVERPILSPTSIQTIEMKTSSHHALQNVRTNYSLLITNHSKMVQRQAITDLGATTQTTMHSTASGK